MSKALSHQLSRDSLSGQRKLGFRLGVGLVGLLAGLLSLSTPGLARATCGDGVVDPGEQCEAPFGGCCNPTTCMIDLPAGEPDLRLRAIKDTRMMQRHQPANDGGAGIIWVKRGGISRGLIGVDYSCQAPASPTVTCAALRTTVYDGVPKKDGTVFAAHRMQVPWVEGNQAFNRFTYAGNLGPFSGSGSGTTWGCQVDDMIGVDGSNDCDASQLWSGADDCDGSLCYDATARKHRWLGFNKPELVFDVTGDMDSIASGEESSWLVKIDVEEVRTGSVKFYQRQGAHFMAENTDGPEAAGYFDYAPSLDVWGTGFTTPAASIVAPASLSVDASPITIDFNQTVGSGESVYPARWHNRTTGEWGYANVGSGADWSADIALNVGINQVEFTVFDACGTEGKTEVDVAYALAPRCGDGWVDDGEECDDGNEVDGDCCSSTCTNDPDGTPCVDQDSCTINSACSSGVCSGGAVAPADCRDSVLCYKSVTARDRERFAGVSGHGFVDHAGAGSLDLKRVSDLCLPAAVSGSPVAEAGSARVIYRAKERSGSRTVPEAAEVTDRFGTISVKLGKLVRFSAEASWQEDGQALAPSGAGVSQACYVARLDGEFPARDEEYSIIDDFEQRWYKLRRPSMLCLASHAPGTTPGNADAHRMCYLARRGWGESKHEPVTGIGTHDAFGELTVDTRTESLVCTPALVAFGD